MVGFVVTSSPLMRSPFPSIHHWLEKSSDLLRETVFKIRWLASSVNAPAMFDNQLDAAARHKGALRMLVPAKHFRAYVIADVLQKVFKLALHLIHLISHIQDDL